MTYNAPALGNKMPLVHSSASLDAAMTKEKLPMRAMDN